MLKLREEIGKVAPTAGRVLVLGESGTGKELIAAEIHRLSKRASGPFVKVNCAAIPAELIESELFGHEKGSFSGAAARRRGQFEVAHGGSLFLDEIGDMSLSAQAKVLRALQTGEITRVGSERTLNVDVRVIAATNKDLEAEVKEGTFREDLFFRLSAVVLRLPPLRERGDDLMIVARALLARLAHEHGLSVPALTPDVIRQLRSHPWPGNIRELKNALERALLLSPRGELSADEFLPAGDAGSTQDGPIPFPAPLHQITAAAVRATVRMSGGNRSEAARRLSISPRRLRRLLSGALDVGADADEGWWVESPARAM
jgi:two-component system, NtrC family, nitrogen regulation response regulator NtrX